MELCALPSVEIIEGPAGPSVTGGEIVEFRLLYQGELLGSSKSDTRAAHKHEIRRSLHPQLRRLWSRHAHLREFLLAEGSREGNERLGSREEWPYTPEQLAEMGFKRIGAQWERHGYSYIPLVVEDYALSCSLDILFLRPEEPHLIFKRGDLDGRIKTVFDALRITSNLDEAGGKGPREGETPFFCLLSDDKLISEVRVSTDELLALPGENAPKANDASLVIHVRLKPRHRNPHGWIFE